MHTQAEIMHLEFFIELQKKVDNRLESRYNKQAV